MLVMLLVIVLGAPAGWLAEPQAPVDVTDLADYRLSDGVFERFVQASGPIADIARHDPAFRYAPLFTKDVALSGDAPAMTAGLIARLENHPGLAAVLTSAKITAREYAKFVITLVGAHLAHGFVKSGVLRRVPSGAPTINVAFVETHETQVNQVLKTLGIND